jgi:hypothetical protein
LQSLKTALEARAEATAAHDATAVPFEVDRGHEASDAGSPLTGSPSGAVAERDMFGGFPDGYLLEFITIGPW